MLPLHRYIQDLILIFLPLIIISKALTTWTIYWWYSFHPTVSDLVRKAQGVALWIQPWSEFNNYCHFPPRFPLIWWFLLWWWCTRMMRSISLVLLLFTAFVSFCCIVVIFLVASLILILNWSSSSCSSASFFLCIIMLVLFLCRIVTMSMAQSFTARMHFLTYFWESTGSTAVLNFEEIAMMIPKAEIMIS